MEIEIDNNYFFINLKTEQLSMKPAFNVQSINWLKIRKNNNILLRIDFDNIKFCEYKPILKKLFKLKKKIKGHNLYIGIKNLETNNTLLGYLLNYDENNQRQKDFICAINAMFYNTLYDMYNYIYDNVCSYLDNQFIANNLCEFEHDKCIEKRCTTSITGCCNHFRHKFCGLLIPCNKLIVCEYLKEKSCSIQCISCKLFTCNSIVKKGFKFKINKILLLDTFFGLFQKYIIKISVYTPKEKVLKKLLLINRNI